MKRKLIQILLASTLMAISATLSFATDFTYTNDETAQATMSRLAERLSQASHLHFSYRILIQHYAEVNAYSTSDGRIVVTQGLLRVVTTEEELAGAIAHEMGHLIPNLQPKAIRTFTLLGGDEFTADKLGMQVLERAGFDPGSLGQMLRVVMTQEGATFPKGQLRQLNERIHKIEKKVGHAV